jgi:hypothetical protein
MLVKVITNIIIEVADDSEAEQASQAVDSGLERAMSQAGFPYEVVDVMVDNSETVSDQEAEEQGWVEV